MVRRYKIITFNRYSSVNILNTRDGKHKHVAKTTYRYFQVMRGGFEYPVQLSPNKVKRHVVMVFYRNGLGGNEHVAIYDRLTEKFLPIKEIKRLIEKEILHILDDTAEYYYCGKGFDNYVYELNKEWKSYNETVKQVLAD